MEANKRKPKCGTCVDATCGRYHNDFWRNALPVKDDCHMTTRKTISVPADPSPEVVEEVARAMCTAIRAHRLSTGDLDADGDRYDDLLDEDRATCLVAARAAIKAMGGKP